MMRSNPALSRALFDLLSSMRFAISLLTVIAIASIIGTVLKQAEPYQNYLIQFGPFWFQLFEKLGLYDVYHAAWFLLILTFLVVSTGLCIVRNTPLLMKEMRTFKEHATDASLSAFAHKHEFATSLDTEIFKSRVSAYLASRKFRFRILPRADDGMLIAAKSGSASHWGYFSAHAAIVVICLGGLLDGNLVFKAQQLLGLKKIETRDIPQSQVPPISRLPPGNPSFRGSVEIPEGSITDVVFLNVADGYLVQDLPFAIRLKKFYIEHYRTGQPKRFASDIEILDPKSGKVLKVATTEVNKPLVYDGIAIYQSSFGDGGTRLTLNGWSLFSSGATPFPVKGTVHDTTRLSGTMGDYQLEFTDFRPFNVENLESDKFPADNNAMSVLGGNPAKRDDKNLRNAGPSFQYKIRNAAGQAREFNNYMLPVQIDGRWYLMSGVRETPNEPFRYLRLPLDGEGRLESFMRLRGALLNKDWRKEIAARFAANSLDSHASPELKAKLSDTAYKVLELFAQGGFQSLGKFIDASVPKAQQDKAADAYLRMIELAGFEALKLANEKAGLPPPSRTDATGWLIRDGLNAFSDMFFYGAPVYLQLASYDEVKSSGLQLTRSPGKILVYLGSLLLVAGIFFMLYVRERRLWLRIKPGHALLAMSTPKKTIDFENEFAGHCRQIEAIAKE